MHVQVAKSESADSDEQSPPGSPVNSPGLFLGAPERSFASGVDSDSYPDDEAEPIPDWDYSDSQDEATDSGDEAADSKGEAADRQLEGAELEDPHVHEGSGTTAADSDMAHGIQSHAHVGQHVGQIYRRPLCNRNVMPVLYMCDKPALC